MADTLTDTLVGTVRTSLSWTRTDTQEVGTITNRQTQTGTYAITDGDGPGEADLVFADARSIPANSIESFDLLNLTQQALGVTVPFTFRQLRVIRLVNESTTAGRRILVGVDPGRPTVVYAAEVGPGSEWIAVNQTDAWEVTAANSVIRIANPNGAAVNYSLYLIGTSTQAAGGSGGSG
ncbi:MAG: hypothetical protein ACK48S_00050 [Planctomycetia bacterium]|jgi:hypothetical protein